MAPLGHNIAPPLSSHPWPINYPKPHRLVNPLSSKGKKKSELRTCGWADDSWGGQEMVELTMTMDDNKKEKRKTQMELVIVESVMDGTGKGRSWWWVVPKVEQVMGVREGPWWAEFWREYWESVRVRKRGRVCGEAKYWD